MANGYNQFFNNPLVMMGAHMMRGADPRMEGLGGLGTGILGTGETLRQQAQLDIENERNRRLADLQMQTLQARMAEQEAQQAERQRQLQAQQRFASQPGITPMQQSAIEAGYGQQVVGQMLRPQAEPRLYEVGDRLINQAGQVVYEPEEKAGTDLETKERAQLANTLRDDFRADTKSFQTISDYWDSFRSAGRTGIGDVTRIFAYMKMVDPASTVREGEFATVGNAGGIPLALRNMYNRVVGGGELSEVARQQLEAEAGNIFNTRLSSYESAASRYRNIAGDYGIEEREIIPENAYERYKPKTTTVDTDQGKVRVREIPESSAF